MDQEEFETLKAIISQSSHLNDDIDIGDVVTDFGAGFLVDPEELTMEEVLDALKAHVQGKLKDGENLIDLYWDIINWAETFAQECYPDNHEEMLEQADIIMDAFWSYAAEILISDEEPEQG